jgi:hypothetical protein
MLMIQYLLHLLIFYTLMALTMYNDLHSYIVYCILYIVFGQIPHPVVSVTKDGSIEYK